MISLVKINIKKRKINMGTFKKHIHNKPFTPGIIVRNFQEAEHASYPNHNWKSWGHFF